MVYPVLMFNIMYATLLQFILGSKAATRSNSLKSQGSCDDHNYNRKHKQSSTILYAVSDAHSSILCSEVIRYSMSKLKFTMACISNVGINAQTHLLHIIAWYKAQGSHRCLPCNTFASCSGISYLLHFHYNQQLS